MALFSGEVETPRLGAWCGWASLAWTERWTSREWPRTKMGTRSQRRGNMAKRLATSGAQLGPEDISTKPMAFFLTFRIHTLNGGAGHDGQDALSNGCGECEAEEQPNMFSWAQTTMNCCASVNESQRETDARRQNFCALVEKLIKIPPCRK